MQDRVAGVVRRRFRRDPQEKRGRILAVARRLLSEQPYEATTTAEIARLAGLSEGSIFHHYRCKRELLQAVAEDYAGDLWDAMFRDAEAEALSFERSFERTCEFISKEGLPGFQSERGAEPQRIVYEVLETRMVKGWTGLIEEQARQGLVRPTSAPMVARWIFSIFASLLADALCRGRSAVSAEQLAEATRWIEGGLGLRKSADH